MQGFKIMLFVLEEDGGSQPALAGAVALARHKQARPAVIDVIPRVTFGLVAPVVLEN
jgi:hypothetical protein